MAILTYPTRGTQKTWDLTEEKHAELEKLFPDIDLMLEFKTALAWIEKNGPKTANGMNLFLLNWLKRAKKAQSGALSWNHDRLPPDPKPKFELDAASARRMELWAEERAAGKPEPAAKADSYARWIAEGYGSKNSP